MESGLDGRPSLTRALLAKCDMLRPFSWWCCVAVCFLLHSFLWMELRRNDCELEYLASVMQDHLTPADNTLRLCTDFSMVSVATKLDFFPLPCMVDCVNHVGAARFISKFDFLKGCYPITRFLRL